MSKTLKDKRLNDKDRDALYSFARKSVQCPAEKDALKKAYDAAKPCILAAVNRRYPQADMKILEKYGAARVDYCIRFGGLYNPDSIFKFDPEDNDAPLVPRYNSCQSHMIDFTLDERLILQEYELAVKAYDKAIKSKLEDYLNLIRGSRTFNDVATIWTAAEAIREAIIPDVGGSRALAVLSAEAIARIKADNAGGGETA